MPKCYYDNPIAIFLDDDPNRILGVMTKKNQFNLEDTQKNSWMVQIEILKRNLASFSEGYILLEYSIPRIGKRVDTVLILRGIVFILEFKVGEKNFMANAVDQALDYALDLKNFHEQSHFSPIVPIVIATEAANPQFAVGSFEDRVYKPLKANRHNLCQVLGRLISELDEPEIDPIAWRDSIYKPTPTIIEAAQALYRGHSVEEISRSDASAINLSLTSEAIIEIINKSKADKQKSICLVTGVPGAGKTLAGLNIANERLKYGETEHAVFLSGNGPLVKVLREALIRNELADKDRKTGLTRKEAISKVQAFIQNIHHFRDAALDSNEPPLERVVIFDEAQRAWTREQTAAFMKRKRGIPDFSMSEPQFLVGVMDRHIDWAVIVCLVGGGQEINTGEAGIIEWFYAIKKNYPHWRVFTSSNLSDNEYIGEKKLTELIPPDQVNEIPNLHLAVSVRSFRSEKVAAFVKAVLDNRLNEAKELYQIVKQNYPIVLTRNLEAAKQWLKGNARGTERYGLLASSGAARLRSIGINVNDEVDVINWFLAGKKDVRSSYYLEEVATEFDVQGLEIDWACVAWDADLRFGLDSWNCYAFRGTKWQAVKSNTRKIYLKNAYRVLLTRARQGMVILVPNGSSEDETRKSTFYDGTYEVLKYIGLGEI